MRLIAIIIATLVCQLTMAQDVSLKIQNGSSGYYPPDLELDVLDENGSIVFTEKDLSIDKPVILEGVYTVKIFTPWGDGVDTFHIKDEAMIVLEPNDHKIELNQKINSWTKDQPKVVKKSFTDANGKFDAVVEFENNILFRYKDGEAKITQYGRNLKMLGKYIAKTSEGYLKMSYNPQNKEIWYVFTDTYNKVVYK